MNALIKVSLILAIISVTAFVVRYICLKCFEPKESVLGKYVDESSDEIKNAKSLEQLELFCPKCTEMLNKTNSLDINIYKYSCKKSHYYYIPIKEIYASQSAKVHKVIIPNIKDDYEIILKWLSEKEYRNILNDQIAGILN
jgi:hypothetical protein